MGMYLGGQKVSPIIKSGATINNQDKTITENGTYTADSGYTGLGEVTVNVPSGQPVITELNVTPTTSAQTILAPSGTDGYSPVNVGAVTSSIDSNITAENIKKDVTILGVTGTLEEGVTPTGTINITQNGTVDVTNYASANVNVSGGGGGDSGGKYLVQVIDYNGTVLKQDHLDTGATFTLPSQPSHTGLTFQSWSSPITITNNTVTVTNSDITIGATYTTVSGLSEFDITLTTVSGLSVTLNMDGTKNWGDGTSDTSTTHTYAIAGDYTITCSGSTMTTSSSSGLFGQSSYSSVYNYYVKNIRFGSSVTSISDYALQYCYSLTSITIPSNVTSIGTQVFYYCFSLASITIPEGVTSIGNSAFGYCYSLTNITIPSSVTSIGAGAFSHCYSLTNITIPSSVTSIDSNTFYNCLSLTNITIPSSVTSIGGSAFQSCGSLTSIIIPEGVTSIGQSAFQYCYSLTNITIPSSVTSIGVSAFEYCHSFTNIAIPSSVTSIGNSAFGYCYSLTNITIPSSVTSIGGSTFYDCYSLTNITIPSSVTSIGVSAFYNCYSILEYDFSNHIAVPTLSSTGTFIGINKICKIKVPWNLCQEWKSATNWSTYADYIDGGTSATLSFTVTPSNSTIYVEGSQIQGTSTSWVGSTAPYVVHYTTNNVVLASTQTGITEGATVNITADLTSYNKITLSIGVTSLSVVATINGVEFSMVEESSGNYSINVVGSGTTVYYFINGGSNYMDASGTITTTGSDITESITLTPAIDTTWTRPNLTANGTLGGSKFAVLDPKNTNTNPYRAVDNSASTYWGYYNSGNQTYIFYNPDALKVTEIIYTYYNSTYRASAVVIQGSNDNSKWVDITSTYSGSNATYTSTLTNDKYYKYYKLTFTQYSSYIWVSDMAITATYKAPSS